MPGGIACGWLPAPSEFMSEINKKAKDTGRRMKNGSKTKSSLCQMWRDVKFDGILQQVRKSIGHCLLSFGSYICRYLIEYSSNTAIVERAKRLI